MTNWLTLILALPTEGTTPRMRAWRALRSAGAAVLRDGVYLLPDLPGHAATLRGIAADVREHGGNSWLLQASPTTDEDFTRLFDRSAGWAQIVADISATAGLLQGGDPAEPARRARRLRKAVAQLAGIDFFPGEAGRQAEHALRDLEARVARALHPDEPHTDSRAPEQLDAANFSRRTWATRARPWIDRLASAWLIRRFIDRDASFLWLPSPQACPGDALGFDFDGARFSHTDGRVTFETLLATFSLETPALLRIGAIVHFLDVGGLAPAEAAGIERIMRGLRDGIADDDALLAAAITLLDGLHTTLEKESRP